MDFMDIIIDNVDSVFSTALSSSLRKDSILVGSSNEALRRAKTTGFLLSSGP